MNVLNPKEVPFNVPVAVTTYSFHSHLNYIGSMEFIVIFKSYEDNGYMSDLLAVNAMQYHGYVRNLLAERALLQFDPNNIKKIEVLEWTSLPLYIGWDFTTPLLANLIKKFDYKNNKVAPLTGLTFLIKKFDYK